MELEIRLMAVWTKGSVWNEAELLLCLEFCFRR